MIVLLVLSPFGPRSRLFSWHASMFKFIDFLSSNNVCLLQKLGCFINYALKIRSDTLYIGHWPVCVLIIFRQHVPYIPLGYSNGFFYSPTEI